MSSLRILLVDNRDSFTWNLAHDLGRFGAEVEVRQAQEWDVEHADDADGIVLSPGPGLPLESVGLMALIEAWAPRHPMLGVCLGMQALVEWSGGALRPMQTVRHGMQATAVRAVEAPLLAHLPEQFEVGHYHSWCADVEKLPVCWRVTSSSASEPSIPLSISHDALPLHGVQFHPESVLTPGGRQILKAWLDSLRP